MSDNAAKKLSARTGHAGACPGSRGAIKMRASVTSEVERIAQTPESFFLLLEVMLPQFLKAALVAELLQELVHLVQQLGVLFAHSDGPGFLLEGLQEGAGRLRVALPVFEGGHLV